MDLLQGTPPRKKKEKNWTLAPRPPPGKEQVSPGEGSPRPVESHGQPNQRIPPTSFQTFPRLYVNYSLRLDPQLWPIHTLPG